MQKHRFNIFPEMIGDDLDRLRQDIENNGYDSTQPIYLYEGAVLDGWNRYRICEELGVEPTYTDFTGEDIEAIEFVMRTNKRRNLTSSQWAVIALDSEELVNKLKQEAEERRKRKPAGFEVEQIPQQKTAEKLAGIFNTNERYVRDIAKIKQENPEAIEQIRSGEKTITEYKKEQKIERRKQEIEEVKRKIEQDNIEIKGKYDVLAIDPPWNYGREYDPETSRVANPYPEMSNQEIQAIELPIKDDAVVFLWTTHAFIKTAFELLEGWGLEYKATMVWDKEKMGMGSTIRMQCEFCLVAVKGKPLIQGSDVRDIMREPRREHSRKPEVFYKTVEQMTTGRRLDYFSREQREGWDTYGAETEKFSEGTQKR